MKVLHMGVAGNLQKYCGDDEYLSQIEIVDKPGDLADEEYLAAAADADVIVVDAVSAVPGSLMERMPNLKMVHSEGVAYNKIDVDAATKLGIYVCNSQGMNASAVAEQAVLLMLGMLRNVVVNHEAVLAGHQIEHKVAYIQGGNLTELADCAVGLVGFGDIARKTAALLHAFGCKAVYYNKRTRLSAAEEAELGVEFRELDDLLAQSDIVSLHVPVSAETAGMANAEFFSKMKTGSYLVNTARGEIVDDEALAAALASGKLAMAGLDTLSNEPVQSSHPLLNQPPEVANKLLLSPHIGGITHSSFARGFAMTLEDIKTVEAGGRPARTVNAVE